MISLTDVVEIVGVSFGIVLAGLAAFAYNKQQKSLSSRDLWRDEAAAEKARADRLEAELGDLRAENVKLSLRVDEQDKAIATLRDMVTGKAEVEALTHLAASHHQETMAVLLHLPELLKEAVA